ncbi:MAG TPA: hypothetical protein VI702_00040 [Nitrospiria bacterium]
MHYAPETRTLDISAGSLPLRSVLGAITDKTGVQFYIPRDMNPIVTISSEGISLERAIQQLMGSTQNAALIYETETGSQAGGRLVLAEVRVLGATSAVSKSEAYASDPTASRPPAFAPMNPILTPEELAARRADHQAKRDEKNKQRENRRREKQGGSEGAPGTPASPQSVQGGGTPRNPQAPPVPPGSSSRRFGRGR